MIFWNFANFGKNDEFLYGALKNGRRKFYIAYVSAFSGIFCCGENHFARFCRLAPNPLHDSFLGFLILLSSMIVKYLKPRSIFFFWGSNFFCTFFIHIWCIYNFFSKIIRRKITVLEFLSDFMEFC